MRHKHCSSDPTHMMVFPVRPHRPSFPVCPRALRNELLLGLLVYSLEFLQTVLITSGKLIFLILTGLVTLLLCIKRYSLPWHSRPSAVCPTRFVFLLPAKLTHHSPARLEHFPTCQTNITLCTCIYPP